jgi:hypothetical protein
MQLRYSLIENGIVFASVLSADIAVEYPSIEAVPHELINIGERWNAGTATFSAALPPEVSSHDINLERDQRIASGFLFQSKIYDCRPDDQTNISGAAQMAFMAIVAGAPAGFFRWHQGATDFGWIAQDNTFTLMDAQTVVALGQAAAAWKQAHMFAGRAIKDAVPIPVNFKDNTWWPHV